MCFVDWLACEVHGLFDTSNVYWYGENSMYNSTTPMRATATPANNHACHRKDCVATPAAQHSQFHWGCRAQIDQKKATFLAPDAGCVRSELRRVFNSLHVKFYYVP